MDEDIDIRTIVKKMSDTFSLNYDLTLIAFLSFLGAVFSHNRIRLKEKINEYPKVANIFTFSFFESGGGKDMTIDFIMKHCFADCYKYIKTDLMQQKELRDVEVRKKVNELYKLKKDEATGRMIGDFDARKDFLAANLPRSVAYINGNATEEGLYEDRYELSLNSSGSILFKHTEFFNFIKKKSGDGVELIETLGGLYECRQDAKAIKSQKNVKGTIEHIPQNLFTCASPAEMHKDKTFNILTRLINTQYARRCFIYFKESCPSDDVTENDVENELTKENVCIDFNKIIFNQFMKTRPKPNKKKIPHQTITEDGWYAEDIKEYMENGWLYKIYQFEKDSKAIKLYSKTKAEWINGSKKFHVNEYAYSLELKNRSWKILKIASFIQSLYSPEERFFTERVIEEAIYYGNYYGGFSKDLISNKQVTAQKVIFDFFKNNLNKEFSTEQIKKELSTVIGVNKFHSEFKEFQEIVDYFIEDKKLFFKERNGGGRLKLYSLTSKEKEMKGE